MEELLNEFDAVSLDQWKDILEKDLKGIGFEQLQQVDDNNILINPFYTIDTSTAHTAVFDHTDWIMAEYIHVKDEKAANNQALSALRSGANGLYFVIEKENIDWQKLFIEIELNYIQTSIYWTSSKLIQETTLNAYLSQHQIDKSKVQSGADALAQYICKGDDSNIANLVDILKANNGLIVIDASIYYNAGANSVSQLAFGIAHLMEYLSQAEQAGVLHSIQKIEFKYALGTAFFEEISKLRALRKLSALLFKQFNISPQLELMLVTGTLFKASFDIYSNLLRDTLAGMAAVLGGCNTLSILPFDVKVNETVSSFSQRMAINQQLLFKEESYLNQFADAANGSFYIDKLSDQLAEAAWEMFKDIESKNGIVTFFESGELKETINKQAEKMIADYISGKKIWIGVNKYPNPTDMPKKMVQDNLSSKHVTPLEIAAYLNN